MVVTVTTLGVLEADVGPTTVTIVVPTLVEGPAGGVVVVGLDAVVGIWPAAMAAQKFLYQACSSKRSFSLVQTASQVPSGLV